jgi:hypothetical protein
MLRSARVVFTILVVLGSFSLSAGAFARGGGHGAGGGAVGSRGNNFAGGFGSTPEHSHDGYGNRACGCVTNSADTVAAMCGAAGAPTMGP